MHFEASALERQSHRHPHAGAPIRNSPRAFALAFLLCACDAREVVVPAPSADEMRALSMRVEAGVQGRFSDFRRTWTLHLEPDGRGAVFLGLGMRETRMDPEVRTFELDFEQLERLREVVLEQRFFELPPVLGRGASDHEPTWIEVHFGPHARRVELQFISLHEVRTGSNGVLGTLAEVERAQAVFAALTEHFPADWHAARTGAGR